MNVGERNRLCARRSSFTRRLPISVCNVLLCDFAWGLYERSQAGSSVLGNSPWRSSHASRHREGRVKPPGSGESAHLWRTPDVPRTGDVTPPARAFEVAPAALALVFPAAGSTADGCPERLNSCREPTLGCSPSRANEDHARVLMRPSRRSNAAIYPPQLGDASS